MGSTPLSHLLILFVPVVGTIALFTYLAVASWSRARQREREAAYRSELLRKLSEMSAEAAAPVLAILREDDARALRRRREGLILAGMIWLVLGVGWIAAGHIVRDVERSGAWAVGILPMLVGSAILFHALVFASRPGSGQPS